MNKFLLFCLVALAAVASAASSRYVVEKKVKVYATPDQLARIAPDVLEFYGKGEGWFIGAVKEPVYEKLVKEGFKIDVLVPDVRAAALRNTAAFHTYEQIRDTLAIIAQNHPDICRLDTIGYSANGNLMLAMKIAESVNVFRGKPRICFDCSIHGIENNGCEIGLYAIIQLVSGYNVDQDITRWVKEREIWIIPMTNPDGLIARTRENGHGYDCNRNYGYAWGPNANGGTGPFSEPEDQALYHLAENHPMQAWSQYHSGATDAMWCWGYTTKAAMDSVLVDSEMTRYGQICGLTAGQISRILYSVSGGSTDWYQGALGAMGYAVEVCTGQPSDPSQIDTINHSNWTAMKGEIERVMWGIRGRVLDSVTGKPVDARITVNPPNWFTYTDSMGYYSKSLRVGTYAVTVEANGYHVKTVNNVAVSADTFTVVNVALAPDTAGPICAYKVITCDMNEKPANINPTFACYALGRHDGVRFSIGDSGWCSFDMGRKTPIINGPGSDFTVYEGDSSPEACSVCVSNDWNGSWRLCGVGTGTQSYDLAVAGLSSARYVRIADVGNGSSGPYAGFDLDAIEAVPVNAPAVGYQAQTVIDSPPGGNANNRLDPGENADLVVALKNAGRRGVDSLRAVLRTTDSYVSVSDSTAYYGTVLSESTRDNNADRFHVAAAANTPLEHLAQMKLYLTGMGYSDSTSFTITVGKRFVTDPVPDGPRTPPSYWAYDDIDTLYDEHPTYNWVEVNGVGTQMSFSNNDAVNLTSIPAAFGPLKFYGQRYTQLSISADGWIACGNYTTSNYTNTNLPNASAPRATVFANWDDLYPKVEGSGYVYYYPDTANHRFIVEYDSVAYVSNTSTRDKFEVIYYDTTVASPSGDNVIVVQYKTAAGFTSSTLGIQDPTRAIAIQDLFNGTYADGAAPIVPGRAIKYTTTAPTGIAERLSSLTPVGRLTLKALGNPSRGRITLAYTLPIADKARLCVYDRTGRLVRHWDLDAGHDPNLRDLGSCPKSVLTWDGTDAMGRKVGAGVYLVRLVAGDKSVVAKTTVVR
ncbi:MAG TPA: M14 family zinc carboxypeptidase [bacterium]|nr:M14 family zinc carboxypeptidase [bacterium]